MVQLGLCSSRSSETVMAVAAAAKAMAAAAAVATAEPGQADVTAGDAESGDCRRPRPWFSM